MGRCPTIGVIVSLLFLWGCSAQTERAPAGASTDFGTTAQHGFATSWPRGGPPRLWSRPLGAGYSGIVHGDGRLYTMYRSGDDEIVACLDASTGETVWEHRYPSRPVSGQSTEYGSGPNAAPLLTGGRLYTVGFSGALRSLDASSGDLLWSLDLHRDLQGNVVELGHAATPVAYRDTIVVVVGGRGRGLMSLDAGTGEVVWRAGDDEASFASPVLATLAGREQIVAFMSEAVVAVDPDDGELLWRYPMRNSYPQNICRPLPLGEDTLFVSTTEIGARGLRVNPGGAGVEAAWSTRQAQCFYTTFARMGDRLYGTSGITAPMMVAVDVHTGGIAWRRRGFRLSHPVPAGDRLILLDDEGKLSLALPLPDGLRVQAETRLLEPPSLTPPTLVGTILFARDQHRIVALDLGNHDGRRNGGR